MKITVLGSGTPEAYARRASSGYLVEIGSDRILLECGGGVFDNLLRAGWHPTDITHLVFSHLHSDHMMDYARLIHAAWDEGALPLPVWGPAPLATITERFFGPDGAFAFDLHARTGLAPSQEVWKARGGTIPRPWPAPLVTEIDYGAAITGDGWHLSTCEVAHAQPFLHCMAFRLETDSGTFVYSGDAALTEDFEAFCAGADLLIHWCYRLDGATVPPALQDLTPSPAEIAAMATRTGVQRLCFTHIRKGHDTPGIHAKALDAARAAFSGPVSILEDLDVLTL